LETSAPPPNIKMWTAGSAEAKTALEKLVRACLMPAMPIFPLHGQPRRAIDKKSMQNEHSGST